MSRFSDTICAPITAMSPAAVGIIRISGAEAFRIGSEIFSEWKAPVESHRALYGLFSTGDDGLLLPFFEGHSYTGDETVECQIHGSLASLNALLDLILSCGARLAKPGEFTERAFLNGRIDLIQAEAVKEMIEAKSDLQFRHASRIRRGELSQKISHLRDQLIGGLAMVEASVDFSEEIGPLDRAKLSQLILAVKHEVELLLKNSQAGKILRNGLRIAIVGPPNAGKSSLLNALLGEDRAIVTDIPGTTRDYIEEEVILGGIPVTLIDTAGVRAAEHEIEAMGIARSFQLAQTADYIWHVSDASQRESSPAAIEENLKDRPILHIMNKADLVESVPGGLMISAKNKTGLEQLDAWISDQVRIYGDFELTISQRQKPHLDSAYQSLESVLNTLTDEYIPDDMASVGLSEAIQQLGEISGESTTTDILDRIFRDFCLGK